MAHLAGKRIAISGAGVGGTAFALALEQACSARSISPMPIIKLYERDATPTARDNLGYSFSLMSDRPNEPAGLQVLRNLGRGVVNDLKKLQEPSNTGNICYRTLQPMATGTSARPDEGEEGDFEVLRIMRTRLRQVLLSKIPTENVHFGKMCTSARPPPDPQGPVRLEFADGSEEECDLLVVADGANSKLRASLLPEEVPTYTGICMLMGRTPQLDPFPTKFTKGHYLVFGREGITLFMGTVDKQTVMWSLSRRLPESETHELRLRLQDPAAAQAYKDEEVPKLASGFDPLLAELIQKTEPSGITAIPAIEKLPHPLQHNNIVYIGDAWHPMSPFAGAGANMALLDAWRLAQRLVEGGHDSIQASIQDFTANEAQRSEDSIKSARRLISIAHSDGWKKQIIVSLISLVGLVVGKSHAFRSLLKFRISGKKAEPSPKAA